MSLSESFHPLTLNVIRNIFGLKFSLIIYILFVEPILFVFCFFLFTSFWVDNFYDHIFPLFKVLRYFYYLIFTLEVIICILNLLKSNVKTNLKTMAVMYFISLCIENKSQKTLLSLVLEYLFRLSLLLFTLFILYFF